jgi:hypothetical protein
MTHTDNFPATVLARFRPITLEEMEAVRLMNRIDTKYVVTACGLHELLSRMERDYFIQETGQGRAGLYRTLYLDTAGADMYLAHHNGCGRRVKVRLREYAGTGLYFFEIKNRDNRGRTHKTRIAVPGYEYTPNGGVANFLERNTPFTAGELSPHLETVYDRITLVNRMKTERLTVDVNLAFANRRTGQHYALPGLAVIELKQDAFGISSTRELLAESGLHPAGLSKYCTGAVLTGDGLKYNRFKPKIRRIMKLIND